jgi:ABC-type Mn2+/Zn2+ transport system ATPase subunit
MTDGRNGDRHEPRFDPHAHPHHHPDERHLPSLEDRAVADPEHARTHASIWLSDVTTGYDQRAALEGIDFAVEPGTLIAIVGPNGAGKSTLLKLMAGLLPAWHGRIEVLGQSPGRQAHRLAYVPQAELVDWAFPVTVGDVVMMGRYPLLGPIRRPGSADHGAVSTALEQVGMAGHRNVQIGRLSGGQRRRVFLARALAADPDVYLLDEPVTGVDATTQEDLMDLLEAEARRGKTVVATTHDLACAAQRFQKVAAVNRRIVAHGPASLVLDPNVLAATYGGHLLVLGGQAVVLDDAHHHDQPSGPEPHFHEESRR